MLAFAARTMIKPLGFLKPVSLKKVPGRFQAHQNSLPRLPVPPLQQTLDHYLQILQPIVSEEEWNNTKQLVDEFRSSGVGERLQKSLERRARKTDNWLSEWWLKTAYLQYRQPVVIHSSPGLVLPKQDFVDSQGQLRFAAKLIEGALDFKAMIDNETLPVEYLGGKPLCMNQYYQILSSCRIPGPKQDSVINYSKTTKPPIHITVVHNFQFFELDVYHSDGTPFTADQIFTQLEKIWNSSLQTNKEPIGILTTNHRNTWAKAYNNLIKDKTNKASVRSIQKSIFTVCLDAPMPRVSEDIYKSRVAGQMLHGGGSKQNSGNRWFDKTLQVEAPGLTNHPAKSLIFPGKEEEASVQTWISESWLQKGDLEQFHSPNFFFPKGLVYVPNKELTLREKGFVQSQRKFMADLRVEPRSFYSHSSVISTKPCAPDLCHPCRCSCSGRSWVSTVSLTGFLLCYPAPA